jgi:HEAT repeat protein
MRSPVTDVYMRAAMHGLVTTGNPGLAALSAVLRGERGSPLGRRVVAEELGKLDREVAVKLVPELIVAIHDNDPDVRQSIAYALRRVLDGEPLVTATRPLFTDTDQDVLFMVVNLITGSNISVPGFVESLSAGDKQTIVESLSRHHYSALRDEAPALLVKFRDRLPPAFVTSVLRQLLLDSDQRVRESAMEAVADLGPPGIGALEDALSSSQVSTLFDALPSGVTRLGSAEGQELLPTLAALRERYPFSATASQSRWRARPQRLGGYVDDGGLSFFRA